MRPPSRLVCAVAMLAFGHLAPDARADAPPCPAGTERYAEYRLFFGRSRDDREVVSDAAWRDFLAREVTPRFPDGLTVLDAAGQWRNAERMLIRERSKLVLILAAPGPDGPRHIDAIIAAYKARFGQESVLRMVRPACAAF